MKHYDGFLFTPFQLTPLIFHLSCFFWEAPPQEGEEGRTIHANKVSRWYKGVKLYCNIMLLLFFKLLKKRWPGFNFEVSGPQACKTENPKAYL